MYQAARSTLDIADERPESAPARSAATTAGCELIRRAARRGSLRTWTGQRGLLSRGHTHVLDWVCSRPSGGPRPGLIARRSGDCRDWHVVVVAARRRVPDVDLDGCGTAAPA